MSYADRPWLNQYNPGMPTDIEVPFQSALEMFRHTAKTATPRPLVHYFGRTLSVGDVDEASDALASAMINEGFAAGDRVAIYMQNVPQFVITVIATWKAGGVVVSINPMSKARELTYVLEDSGASVLVTLESLYADVAKDVVAACPGVRTVITTNEIDLLGERPALLAGSVKTVAQRVLDLVTLLGVHEGVRPPDVTFAADDIAFLTYTSGTTGPPKGAMNTHRNVVFNSEAYRTWMSLTPDDVVLGVAPLFHITGLIAHLTVAVLVPMPIVLAYRFDPATMLDQIERYRPTFTVGAITVFIALMNDPSCPGRALSSLTKVYSGGAPIAPTMVERFEKEVGPYIHNIYGLTETTSPSHGVPMGKRSPVDPTSGALSVGVPIFNTVVRVIDDDGNDVPTGEIGEFVTSGPQVVVGYWNKPDETAHALPGGDLHTGDVGFMDADGWYYVVDRKKDMIIASGYKVWPREVEDILYQHPAVREAAVVGVPDEYRGETVKAFVSLRPGESATETELIAFCKERMSAYKYPRSVEMVDELPKTVTGKILRRELRAKA
jgi:long-chain acyl-CoA synthetase